MFQIQTFFRKILGAKALQITPTVPETVQRDPLRELVPEMTPDEQAREAIAIEALRGLMQDATAAYSWLVQKHGELSIGEIKDEYLALWRQLTRAIASPWSDSRKALRESFAKNVVEFTNKVDSLAYSPTAH